MLADVTALLVDKFQAGQGSVGLAFIEGCFGGLDGGFS